QFTLSELYERRKKDRLTLKAYDAIGGVSGALAGRADELYDQLSPAQQTIAQQMFLRLVTPGEGAEDTRRRALQSELLSLAPDENDVLYVMETFGKHRLFTFDHDPTTRTPTVEIAHEALIRSWGTLRLWLDQNRSDLRLQRQLAAAATDWLVANRDASFLATGARLAQFEALADAPVALNTTERAYLEASIKQRRRQQQKG